MKETREQRIALRKVKRGRVGFSSTKCKTHIGYIFCSSNIPSVNLLIQYPKGIKLFHSLCRTMLARSSDILAKEMCLFSLSFLAKRTKGLANE